jgi:hypothetical protein
MIDAEALEISQVNADQYLDSNDPKAKLSERLMDSARA